MKKPVKLVLRTETLRRLSSSDFVRVVGGEDLVSGTKAADGCTGLIALVATATTPCAA